MRVLYGLLICLCVALAGVYSFSPRSGEQLRAHHIPVENMRLNDIVRTSAGIVVIGELGNVLFSVDEGVSWTSAKVDRTRYAMLNQAVFITPDVGLAVGHQGWIIRTEDGGKTWQEVHFDEKRYDPLLSLQVMLDGSLFAVGAFGLSAQSFDQGKSWRFMSAPDNIDWHLNALVRDKQGKKQLLLGEQGVAFQKSHNQTTWTAISPFYNGSLYGGVALASGEFLVYGMRGNVFMSNRSLSSWQSLENPIPVSFFAHYELSGGEVLLAGQGGGIFIVSSDSRIQPLHLGKRWSITGLIELSANEFLLSTDEGLKRLSLAESLKGLVG